MTNTILTIIRNCAVHRYYHKWINTINKHVRHIYIFQFLFSQDWFYLFFKVIFLDNLMKERYGSKNQPKLKRTNCAHLKQGSVWMSQPALIYRFPKDRRLSWTSSASIYFIYLFFIYCWQINIIQCIQLDWEICWYTLHGESNTGH